ncbi:hypothetical protein DFP72DRAFT_38500 [Ephemerocybe angulata]|uniref:C3H1-type domain-containing protein n=1 Tax=Ephemerocybe angulata TaxID=980116 RepID=A0A8H6I9E0_9AGAR|nr:hypothetical protein DFP72DRAFT_38500 [Tulosesus angulatus]
MSPKSKAEYEKRRKQKREEAKKNLPAPPQELAPIEPHGLSVDDEPLPELDLAGAPFRVRSLENLVPEEELNNELKPETLERKSGAISSPASSCSTMVQTPVTLMAEVKGEDLNLDAEVAQIPATRTSNAESSQVKVPKPIVRKFKPGIPLRVKVHGLDPYHGARGLEGQIDPEDDLNVQVRRETPRWKPSAFSPASLSSTVVSTPVSELKAEEVNLGEIARTPETSRTSNGKSRQSKVVDVPVRDTQPPPGEGVGTGKTLELGTRRSKPHVYVLIDGDGCIPTPQYFNEGNGYDGGRKVAEVIVTTILEYYEGVLDYRLSIYLFFNREGLRRALRASGEYIVANFDRFWEGFQAPGLIFVVDTGETSQSADEKLKEVFKAYIHAPDTRNIFLAACHDGGYRACFDAEIIDIFRRRMILVKYLNSRLVPSSIKTLNFPEFSFPDIFRDEELIRPPPPPAHDDEPANELVVLNADTNPAWRDRGQPLVPAASTPTSATSQQMPRTPVRSHTLDRGPQDEKEIWEKPMRFPCLYELFELDTREICSRPGCVYQHGLRDSPTEAARIARLREYVRHTYPCEKGTQSQCRDTACIRAHVCPYGPCCSLREVGYCKFSEEMHRPFEENLEDLEYLLLRTVQGYRKSTNAYQPDEYYSMLQRVAAYVLGPGPSFESH